MSLLHINSDKEISNSEQSAKFVVRVSSEIIQTRPSHARSEGSRNSEGILEDYAKKFEVHGETSLDDAKEDEDHNIYDDYAFFDEDEETAQMKEEEDKEQQHDANLTLSLEECSQFLDTVTFAKAFVDHVVEECEADVENNMVLDSNNIEKPEDDDRAYAEHPVEGFDSSEQFPVFQEDKSPNMTWPTIEEFTVELGAYSIDEYLSYFDTYEDWMYVIYCQGQQESPCCVLHKYQAIYSLPTWKYPIAQATASIYFVIEACKVKPPHCLVDVTYRYETFRQMHKPGEFDFNEKWLHYILDSKIKFFQTVIY